MIGSTQRTDGMPARPADAPIGDDEIPVLRLAVPISRRRRLVAACVAGGALLGLVLTLVLPSRFVSQTSFTVENSGPGIQIPSGISGIAGELGMSLLAGASKGPTPDYFIALTRSSSIRKAIVHSRFDNTGAYVENGGTPLIDLLNVRGRSPRDREEKAMRKLGRMVAAGVDRKADIVTVSVTDRTPERAAAIANRLFSLLNHYNVERRQTHSRLLRQFAEKSLREAQVELRTAENRFQDFLTRNKVYAAPPLRVEYTRLQWNIEQKQSVVETLARKYEEARIAEAGDIPVLSVIDRGEPPARRSFPKWWMFVPTGLVLGLLLGSALAVAAEARRSWKTAPQAAYVPTREPGRAWPPTLRRPEGEQRPATVD
jgi:uncharacterized protein involved in exopolysaccharide biosynthesis